MPRWPDFLGGRDGSWIRGGWFVLGLFLNVLDSQQLASSIVPLRFEERPLDARRCS